MIGGIRRDFNLKILFSNWPWEHVKRFITFICLFVFLSFYFLFFLSILSHIHFFIQTFHASQIDFFPLITRTKSHARCNWKTEQQQYTCYAFSFRTTKLPSGFHKHIHMFLWWLIDHSYNSLEKTKDKIIHFLFLTIIGIRRKI